MVTVPKLPRYRPYILFLSILLASCASTGVDTDLPDSDATLERQEPTNHPSETATESALASPTIAPLPSSTPQPLPTVDPEVVHYLDNVEAILRHSAVVVKERAIGIADACPTRYILAFPYKEPDREGGMTLHMSRLVREADGTIIEGEHEYVWNLKGEGVDPERCKAVIIEDRSVEGFIRILFRVQSPYDSSWRIGVASGECPGDEVWLSAYFNLEHPENHALEMTQYDPVSPVDYWLQDGDQLLRYHWEPWTEELLWIMDDVPGRLLSVEWNENSPDYSGDGTPDLVITWEISGEPVAWAYAAAESGFTPLGPVE